jgi:hypothetical protein
MAALGQVEKSVVLEKMELSSDVISPLMPLNQFALKMESSVLQFALSSHNDVHIQLCRGSMSLLKKIN